MKALWCFILSFMVTTITSVSAQPDWVKAVVKEGGTFSVSEEASAIVLHNEEEVEIGDDGKATSKIRVVYKILTGDGKTFGTKSLPVNPQLTVKKTKGWLVKSDSRVISLSKENIATVSMQESAGYYDDNHLYMASLPSVESGDIAAFELSTEEKGWMSHHHFFVFQRQQPVRYARYSVTIPEGWRLTKAEWNTEEVHYEQSGNRHVWTARHLPHQPQEPLAPSWYYLSKRVSVTCFDPQQRKANQFPDWSSVAAWCEDMYSEPAAVTEKIMRETRSLTEGMTTAADKIQAIAAFVRDDIRYVAVEIGKGRWIPRRAETTLFNRYGDCKDKTTLMRSMLNVCDIQSAPAMANMYYPVDPRLPSPFQFNHCIIAVPVEEEIECSRWANALVRNWLFFDPTDPSTRLGELPWSLQGSRVLLGSPGDTVLFRLPYPDPEDYRRTYRVLAQLTPDGSCIADVTVTDYGGWAAASGFTHRRTPEKEQQESWRSVLSATVPALKLTDYRASGNEDSVWVSFSLEGDNVLRRAGQFLLLKPDIFHRAEPPKLTADERVHPIWFGAPRAIETNVLWQLPTDWIVEVDTPNFRSRCGAATVTMEINASEGFLRFTSVQQQNGLLVWPEDYETARTFSADISFVKGQTVLIRKQHKE